MSAGSWSPPRIGWALSLTFVCDVLPPSVLLWVRFLGRRNYGGFLIIWDRLFGTFQEEEDSVPPVFGDTHPLRSWNPVWHTVHHFWLLYTRLRQFPKESWSDKLKLIVKGTYELSVSIFHAVHGRQCITHHCLYYIVYVCHVSLLVC